jgi:acyl-CoA thioester hydrolase
MAVIHHSNYIRWFEEARVNFLEQIGLGYDKIEAADVYSPVLSVNCEYKSAVKFNDMVVVLPKLVFFNGIKMTIGYRIIDAETKQLRAVGESKHCFVSTDFKPVSLKKDHMDMYETLIRWVGAEIEF